MKYYHGGAPKLKEILPPSVTGAPSNADYGAAAVCRRDRVYLTTDVREAMLFAALHPSNNGTVYEVRPAGGISHDPDYLGPQGGCVEAERADIIRVVPVKKKELFKIRRWILADHQKGQQYA